jgi:hypothetical protein
LISIILFYFYLMTWVACLIVWLMLNLFIFLCPFFIEFFYCSLWFFIIYFLWGYPNFMTQDEGLVGWLEFTWLIFLVLYYLKLLSLSSLSNNLIFLFFYSVFQFQFHFSILGCLGVKVCNFFNLLYVELFQSRGFIYFFYFSISTFNIRYVGNEVL